MKKEPVIAVFDVGKTNKKMFLFNQRYQIVYERTARFNEIEDEEGFPCENVEALRSSLIESLREICRLPEYSVKAVNFSAYGAALILLDTDGQVMAPLYNYLKPFPEDLSHFFKEEHDTDGTLQSSAASPYMGNLNTGLQLFRIKKRLPEVFARTAFAVHLSQYLSYVLTGQPISDITNVGCHSMLWNYEKGTYQAWAVREDIVSKLPPLSASQETIFVAKDLYAHVGIGIHDSSAALVPYLMSFKEPFLLLSTGTWSITLNPFSNAPLTAAELDDGCLCYLSYTGQPVKASRLFSGFTHDESLRKICQFFDIDRVFIRTLKFDSEFFKALLANPLLAENETGLLHFDKDRLDRYANPLEAYYHLIWQLCADQRQSSMLVCEPGSHTRMFVDGGFAQNDVFMSMLSYFFHEYEVYAAQMPQASALGAALLLHKTWNKLAIPNDLVELKLYRCTTGLDLHTGTYHQ